MAIRIAEFLLATSLVLVMPLNAGEFTPRELSISVSRGASGVNDHGRSLFNSVHLELTGRSAFAERWLQRVEAGAVLSYSDMRQAHSWFGYRDGEGDDSIRAESLTVFLRRRWCSGRTLEPFAEIGTGPMWSNRRVPAATSRFNMSSEVTAGLRLTPYRLPLLVAYRFSHISNGGTAPRNPGLNVNSFIVGAVVHRFER